MTARIHSTPPEAISDLTRETVYVDDYTFYLQRPTGIDQLWEHPAVRAAYAADEYIPYWSELWPAGRMLARAIVREDWSAMESKFGQPLHALEIGCGLGLAGIAALAKGMKVTFTDVDEMAAVLAGNNAKLNGFHQYETKAIDVRSVPEGLQVPILFASDVLYEPRLIGPVVQFVKQALQPGGVCLVGDADRISARPFKHEVFTAGMVITGTPTRVGEPGGSRTKGTIYRITHPE
ncbi:MAG: 50S ribosomal protein L11 methyltransferase [Gemmataceae bacterium]